MAYRVEVTATAGREIEQAYRWIRDASPAAAERWYAGLMASLASLRDHPRRCPLAPEADAFNEEIRQLLYGQRGGRYRVLFRIEGDGVLILHVRHGARRPLGRRR